MFLKVVLALSVLFASSAVSFAELRSIHDFTWGSHFQRNLSAKQGTHSSYCEVNLRPTLSRSLRTERIAKFWRKRGDRLIGEFRSGQGNRRSAQLWMNRVKSLRDSFDFDFFVEMGLESHYSTIGALLIYEGYIPNRSELIDLAYSLKKFDRWETENGLSEYALNLSVLQQMNHLYTSVRGVGRPISFDTMDQLIDTYRKKKGN